MPLQLFSGPIDYASQLEGAPDIGQMLLKGYQEAEQRKVLQAQLARQMQQQAALDEAREAAIRAPSVDAFNKLLVLDPKNAEATKAAWAAKDADAQKTELAELSAVRGYLRAGKPELARQALQRRIDADKKAGQDTADDEEFVSIIDEDPEGAAGYVDYMIAASIGPEKWSEAFGQIGTQRNAAAKLPSEIAENTATAAASNAMAGKTIAETVQVAPNAIAGRNLINAQIEHYESAIQERADRVALDYDKLKTDVQMKLEEAAAKGTEVSPHFQKVLGDSVIAAESNRSLANRARGLAERVGALGNGGTAAQVQELIKGAYGSPTLLRKEFAELVNARVIEGLPPGPASDRDIAIMKEGFPKPNANAATMKAFLETVARLQEVKANRDQAKADWISDNGSLGTAKRDLTVNGVRVPKGSTFGDFSKSQSASERRENVTADRSYMRFGNGSR
jgi:hypothetical protein